MMCICVFVLGTLNADRFKNESQKYVIAIKGKERTFYPYKAYDYLSVTLKEIFKLDADETKYFKRNPHICFRVKTTMVFSDFITVYGFSRKVFFRDTLIPKLKNIAKGDNLWLFAKFKIYENNDYDIIVQYFFDLPSDEEIFIQWRKSIPADDENKMINLGFKALETGVKQGNLTVWKKLGLQTIEQGLKIKQQKLTNPAEYITIASKVMKLIDDKDFALKVILAGWEKNKENSGLKNYLRNVLEYAQYEGAWMPEKDRYEKDFSKRFNAIKYTEDDKMWDLKRWVELNADKFRDPQEKIIRCARRTFEMNPARKDAAAFLGKEPSLIQGFTSSDVIVVPRKPIKVSDQGGTLEFTLDNIWVEDSDIADPVKKRYKTESKGEVTVMVTAIEWGANLEELNTKYISKVNDLPEYKLLENDTVTLKGKTYYWVRYTYSDNNMTMKTDALLVRTKKDFPGLAVLFTTPESSYDVYTKEFANIRESLVYKE